MNHPVLLVLGWAWWAALKSEERHFDLYESGWRVALAGMGTVVFLGGWLPPVGAATSTWERANHTTHSSLLGALTRSGYAL